VRSAATLLDHASSEAIRALLVQQIVEPRTERALRENIPALTAVADGVSRRVQRQYEESPYPRWVRSPAPEPVCLEAHLRGLFPRAAFPPAASGNIDILVAGCGTGQESVDLARRFPDSRVLAIDLSRASLGYALRKTRELQLANVEYAQADIVELESIGRSFDLISCVGVMHHLADPAAGWRRLLAMLRPGGFMQVGLYSEIGRRDLAAARELIAARGYEPTPAGIRRCRQELLASDDFARLASLRDLYGMNECRDLLFHAQEHRFTLPQVKGMVAALGLDFIGLAVEPGVMAAYRQRFPGRASEADPDSWHAFEMEFPDTFAGMYLFWVRKRDGS
jgi:2-polyprenyl-3-methyl-5-hydroxy-6-metoxy-1,4-benzoquinol methylase